MSDECSSPTRRRICCRPTCGFCAGVVDSEDLPLNISREMLQSNPMVARIRQQLTRRVLSELAKKAGEAADEYAKFWDNFGAVLKEGLYEDRDHREELLGLARFRSTSRDELVSLDDYIAAMKPGQDAIYTIHGDNLDVIKKSPQLEGFRARGVEVLLMTDPIDEFWVPAIGQIQGKAVQIGDPRRNRSRQDPVGRSARGKGSRTPGETRQSDRDFQTGARRRRERCAQFRATDGQRRLPGRRRGRYGHASRAPVEAASSARHRLQTHSGDQPAAHADRAAGCERR